MPLDFQAISSDISYSENLHNVSAGGLCFNSAVSLDKGTSLKVNIPNLRNTFEENCTVMWCKNNNENFQVGVQFKDEQTVFRMRMVEQVCHIEDYRQEVFLTERRELSAEDASQEWIEKYANRFPRV